VHPTRLLVLLWIAFLLRGLWYCCLLPVWEGYDEPFHFAALENVASGDGMPHSSTPITLEVQESLHLLPLPWELQFQQIPQPLTVHDDFWRLSPDEQARRINTVRQIPWQEGNQAATEPILNYESQQAPLYYWLFGVPLGAIGAIPLLSRFFVIRLLGLLFSSLLVPIAYSIGKQVFRNGRLALGVVALLILLPELMVNLARVSNETLAVVLYSLLLLFCLRIEDKPASWPDWTLAGLTLGLGLLTKAYFLTTVPAMAVVVALALWSSQQHPDGRQYGVLLRAAFALLLALLIAGRYYLHIHQATGSWSGQGDDVAMGHIPVSAKVAAIPHVNWKSGVLSVLISHVWFGGWSFLRVPAGIYVLAFLLIALAFFGVLVRFWRGSDPISERRRVLVLAAFYATLLAGIGYHILVTFLNQGVSASTGWYLYAAVTAELVLMVWGLQALFSPRMLFGALAVFLAATDLYGTVAALMPYYTGLTAHINGRVPPDLWGTISRLPLVFERLSYVRPTWLSAPALVVIWLLYCAATVGSVPIIFGLFWKPAARTD
jgi:hypothetical protein